VVVVVVGLMGERLMGERLKEEGGGRREEDMISFDD